LLSSRSLSATLLGAMLLLGGLSLTGCQPDATVTKQEETQFLNPPKEMPEAAREAMRRSGGGGPPPAAAAAGKGAPPAAAGAGK
jgi:hypothetical protein